jgi:hypothetical protein
MSAIENPEIPLCDDLLWGAQAIADELGVDVRRAFYLLENNFIPATKTGATWTTTKTRLRRFFDGEMPAADDRPDAPRNPKVITTSNCARTRRRVGPSA